MKLWVNIFEHLHEAKFLNCEHIVPLGACWSAGWLLCLLVHSLVGGAVPAAEVLLDLKVIES
jgi:hypothetical protein